MNRSFMITTKQIILTLALCIGFNALTAQVNYVIR
jgi:hypothetical protein